MFLPVVMVTAALSFTEPMPQTQAVTGEKTSVTKESTEKSTVSPVSTFMVRTIERNIVHYTNEQRRRHGLPELTMDVNLISTARQHASWMASSNNLRHTSLPVAENIAMGQRNSAEAVRDWMNSPGHRANMLGRGYTRIGAAAYRSASGAVYWCVQFLR